jgi:type II secretory pathway pseudopilin PulG
VKLQCSILRDGALIAVLRQCGSQVAETSFRPCPACGNPTNGAVRPQLATGGSSSFVVAMVAIVLAVLAIPIAGILAAIAIPNFLTAKERAKQKRTMADVRAVAVAVETYRVETNAFPENLDGIDAPKVDGWGHALRYECFKDEGATVCTQYAITSAGKDGLFESDSARTYTEQTTQRFDCDILFANGQFVQYPEGVRN